MDIIAIIGMIEREGNKKNYKQQQNVQSKQVNQIIKPTTFKSYQSSFWVLRKDGQQATGLCENASSFLGNFVPSFPSVRLQ